MKFENRQTQFPGRKKVKKLNSDNQLIEEYYVVMENAEGTANPAGTPVSATNLNKGNWRDDTNISFKTLTEGEDEPIPQPGRTQIYTKRNGETWIVPSAESGAPPKVITDPAGSVIFVDKDRPPVVEFDEDPQDQIDKKADLDSFNNLSQLHYRHVARYDNPHMVTKAQIGLGNADNTSDADKPVSNAVRTALDMKADLSGGAMPNPIYSPTLTLEDAVSRLHPNTTVSYISTNPELGYPFTEIDDEHLISGKLTALSSNFIENTISTYDVEGKKAIHATNYQLGGTWRGWSRPKGWVTYWTGAAKHGTIIEKGFENGERIKVHVMADNSCHSAECVVDYRFGPRPTCMVSFTGYVGSSDNLPTYDHSYGIAMTTSSFKAFTFRKSVGATVWSAPVASQHIVTKIEKEVYM